MLADWFQTECRCVLVDADDTLWHDEKHFRHLAARVVALVPEQLATQVNSEIRSNRDRAEAGERGFANAVRSAVLRVTTDTTTVESVESAIDEFLNHPVEVLPGAADTLAIVGSVASTYIYTKGVNTEQMRKIESSGLREAIADIVIVPHKNAEALRAVMSQLQCSAVGTLVIGNSLKHDIAPAIDCGTKVIWLNHSENFRGRNLLIPAGITECASWVDVRRHLLD